MLKLFIFKFLFFLLTASQSFAQKVNHEELIVCEPFITENPFHTDDENIEIFIKIHSNKSLNKSAATIFLTDSQHQEVLTQSGKIRNLFWKSWFKSNSRHYQLFLRINENQSLLTLKIKKQRKWHTFKYKNISCYYHQGSASEGVHN